MNKQFAQVPDSVQFSGLPSSSFRLWVYLRRRQNLRKGYSWPSYSTIEKEVGLSKSTSIRAIRALEGVGLLAYQKGGGRVSNRYTVFDEPNGSPEEPAAGCADGSGVLLDIRGEPGKMEEERAEISAMAKPKKRAEYPGDPIETVGRKARTSREKRAEATSLSSRGHIVNPLGKPDNAGRRLDPKRARPIGEIGEPTDAQLYAYLLKRFEDNGWKGVLEQEIPPFREHVSIRFAELRQKFISICGVVPKNRMLYNYFQWFLNPKSVSIFTASARKAGRDYVSWYQMCGDVCIRRFYDAELKSLKTAEKMLPTKRQEKIQEDISYLTRAFDRMKDSEESEAETVACMREFGIVLYAQFLCDMKGADGSRAKQSVIGTLKHFFTNFPDIPLATEYLSGIAEATKANAEQYRAATAWPEWEGTVNDIIKMVVEGMGKKAETVCAGNEEEVSA